MVGVLTNEETDRLVNAYAFENKEFATTIMMALNQHSLLSEQDVESLADVDWCKLNFHSSYPILKRIDSALDLSEQLKYLPEGNKRYYSDVYEFFGQEYAVCSQFFNKKAGTSKNNKLPFYQWAMTKIPVKSIVSYIQRYLLAKGFSYENAVIENFYLSLKSKPFVILAGTSGTGKTRLVRLFAEAIGAQYKTVAVRPDWSDSSDLFGHVDLNGQFIPGAVIDFIKAAAEDESDIPYFLCLDEMNLARVEYYLSDFLSIIETRKREGGAITTDILISKSTFGSDEEAAKEYGELRIPENLYIVGTVNMDETTFPFSKKVLDRANTIEFSYVNLDMPKFAKTEVGTNTDSAGVKLPNSIFRTDYLLLADCANLDDATYEKLAKWCEELNTINSILREANSHVGYRVRDEIIFYLLNNLKADLMPENEAMDYAIMQKILPRIQGSSSVVLNMLCDLFKHCCEEYKKDNSGIQFEDMLKVAATGKYRNSSEKIAFMVRRFEEDGFTSFWL